MKQLIFPSCIDGIHFPSSISRRHASIIQSPISSTKRNVWLRGLSLLIEGIGWQWARGCGPGKVQKPSRQFLTVLAHYRGLIVNQCPRSKGLIPIMPRLLKTHTETPFIIPLFPAQTDLSGPIWIVSCSPDNHQHSCYIISMSSPTLTHRSHMKIIFKDTHGWIWKYQLMKPSFTPHDGRDDGDTDWH